MPTPADNSPIGWLDVEEIALRLLAAHPEVEPYSLRFTQLRRLVEALPGFTPDPEHPVNEKILETIQGTWQDEREDAIDDDADDDEE